MIHVRTWNAGRTARVVDMTNAGKRGKVCRVLRFSGYDYTWRDPSDVQRVAYSASLAIMEVIEGFLDADPNISFGTAAGIVEAMRDKARADGVPVEWLTTYREEIRGVDAPVEPLEYILPGVFSARADESGISIADLNDINEWREITPHRQKGTVAYKLARKVWGRLSEAASVFQAANILRAAGCKLHGYCGMD